MTGLIIRLEMTKIVQDFYVGTVMLDMIRMDQAIQRNLQRPQEEVI